MCVNCIDEGMQINVFADLINSDIVEELLKRPRWLRYRANCYYDRADSNLSNDLDRDELASVVERICVELGAPVSEVITEELDMDRPVQREEFVIIFRTLLRRCLLYTAIDDEELDSQPVQGYLTASPEGGIRSHFPHPSLKVT